MEVKKIILHHYNSKRNLVNAFKEGDNFALQIMALEMAKYCKGTIIPVPSTSGNTLKLAKMIAQLTGHPYISILRKKSSYISSCLRRKRGLNPLPYAKLSNNIYALTHKKFARVTLIDDVITSGNTVKACLSKIKAKKIDVVIYATASRKKSKNPKG